MFVHYNITIINLLYNVTLNKYFWWRVKYGGRNWHTDNTTIYRNRYLNCSEFDHRDLNNSNILELKQKQMTYQQWLTVVRQYCIQLVFCNFILILFFHCKKYFYFVFGIHRHYTQYILIRINFKNIFSIYFFPIIIIFASFEIVEN